MVTRQILEDCYTLSAEINAIITEINALYKPNIYAGGERIGARGNEPSNPTERAAITITDLREKLKGKLQTLYSYVYDIEEWLDTVEESEIRAIIRWHYVNGKNWNQTNIKVYGYPDYFYSRQKALKYLQKQGIL